MGLKREYQTCNLFQAEWWHHIAGKEHLWARALHSSQCFAVNLFAPLREDKTRARDVLSALLPARELGPAEFVSAVEFEFTPDGTQEWLGEKDSQPTQIDVYFQISRRGECIGHVLVEVKLSESRFGRCRGWNGKLKGEWLNPSRDRCRHVTAVISDPRENCWLTQERGRRYWEILSKPGSSFRESAIRDNDACPFRDGLYQMIRNRLLADELVRHTGAAWADFVICRHPGNEAVFGLENAVLSSDDAIAAFRSLSSSNAVHVWDAEEVVGRIGANEDRLRVWETWMRKRYFES